jgi:periplasmic protein TonB
VASPASNAPRPDGGTAESQSSTSPASSARAACEVIAVSTSDEFLLELGVALGGQASVRPVDGVDTALEHLGNSRRAQLIAFDARSVTGARAAIERLHSKAPQVSVLAFVDGAAAEAAAAELKGASMFAVVTMPMDPRTTMAAFEGALEAAAKRAARTSYAQKPMNSTSSAGAPAADASAAPQAARKVPIVPLAAGGVAVVLVAGAAAWYFMRDAAPRPVEPAAVTAPAEAFVPDEAAAVIPSPAPAPVALVEGTLDELLEKARLAMRERRFTEPANDNALVYFRSALAVDAANGEASDGLARIGGVLIARVDEAMSTGNLDEAASALLALKAALPNDARVPPIETRVTQAQVARAIKDGDLERAAALVRAAQGAKVVPAETLAQWRADIGRRQDEARIKRFTDLATERLRDGRLVEPANDNAKYFAEQLRSVAPNHANTQRIARDLTAAYMRKAREASAAGRTAEADKWFAEARGAGVSAEAITTIQRDLAASKQRAAAAEADRFSELARERLKQGRLTEPSNDSAAAYLVALQSADSSHAALASAKRELAERLIERAGTAAREGRTAQMDADLAAARRWGADSKDVQGVQQLAAATKTQATAARGAALQRSLKRVRYVPPEYPTKALEKGIEGAVTIDFVVDEKGETTKLEVTQSEPAGVFDRAALNAVRRWRYAPVGDGTAVEVPTRAVIRFEGPKE